MLIRFDPQFISGEIMPYYTNSRVIDKDGPHQSVMMRTYSSQMPVKIDYFWQRWA